MRFKKIYILLFLITIVSCKSKKNAVAKNKKYKIENTKRSEVVRITPQKKKIKKSKNLTTVAYIKKYRKIAMDEMRDYKIPASITLAQGILESRSGNSELTKKSNNHFGIKCHKRWNGHRAYHDDDNLQECFRVYKNPRGSFSDHSKFLTTRKRYAKLFKLSPDDYVGWAKGLSRAGYATDRRYPAKLIAIIEKYNLAKYDAEVLGKKYRYKKKKSSYIKESKTHIVRKGDTLYSISKKYGITVTELKKLNGLTSTIISVGQALLVN